MKRKIDVVKFKEWLFVNDLKCYDIAEVLGITAQSLSSRFYKWGFEKFELELIARKIGCETEDLI